jgi:hypothetical protein
MLECVLLGDSYCCVPCCSVVLTYYHMCFTAPQGFEKDELDPFKMSFAAAGNHRHISADNTVRYCNACCSNCNFNGFMCQLECAPVLD